MGDSWTVLFFASKFTGTPRFLSYNKFEHGRVCDVSSAFTASPPVPWNTQFGFTADIGITRVYAICSSSHSLALLRKQALPRDVEVTPLQRIELPHKVDVKAS